MSLVEKLTLDTSEVSLSDNNISSAGNATIAFEYHCYKIEVNLIIMGQRLRFQNKNCL
jgi:hypothetical protein